MTNVIWAWTSEDDGSGLGTAYQMGGIPENWRHIEYPPEPSISHAFMMRYWYDATASEWKLKGDAEPAVLPNGFYAWNGLPRYDVDATDPLRNSWVIKPDAIPVIRPEEE